MSHLDPGGTALLQILERARPGLFGDVADATGADDDGRVRLRVDAARRVVDATVQDVSTIRRTERLRDAVVSAFAAADAARAADALTASGRLEEWLTRADEDLRERGHTPDVARPDVRRDSVLARLGADRRPVRRSPAPGTSDNGYLSIQRNRLGSVVGLEADQEWLAGARAEHIEAAIIQAAHYQLED